MKIYLAGKISQGDWRHSLVGAESPYSYYSTLRSVSGVSAWREVVTLPVGDEGHLYTGPFFIACDHGCAHKTQSGQSGSNKEVRGHAVSSLCAGSVDEGEVLAKCRSGIKACDLFVVWMGLDFDTAYGTMMEIGIALTLGKQIAFIIHPELNTKEFWFLKSAANLLLVDESPVRAFKQLLCLGQKKAA